MGWKQKGREQHHAENSPAQVEFDLVFWVYYSEQIQIWINISAFSVACNVSDWGPWQNCNVTCGNGTETRNRHVTVPPINQNCSYHLVESQPCFRIPCPGITNFTKRKHVSLQNKRKTKHTFIMLSVDCVVGNWSTWGLCSQSCGGGLQGRGRDVLVQSDHGGDPCPADLAETQYCINEDCPKGETD